MKRQVAPWPQAWTLSQAVRLSALGAQARRAERAARLAGVAAVQDEPMMCVALVFHRHVILQRAFHRDDVLAGADPGAVAHAKDMGVDRLGGVRPMHVQHHIRGLAAHAGQPLQGGAGIWYFAAILINQNLAQLHDILGFLPKQPDCFDVFNQSLKAQINHFLRGVYDLEQSPRGLVDAHIGSLCA